MKIAIIGYGAQGRAAYDYWNRPENEITICDYDENVTIPEGATSRLGREVFLKDLDEFDLLVRSPIIKPSQIAEANSPEILEKVTSVTNEFMRVCPTKNIIGVTGTKGKGTTTTIIARILEADGKRVHLGGNIGTPPLDLLANNIQPEDWVVLELANFQLLDLKQSPPIGVCVQVNAEHLDWHGDETHYFLAKQQLFAHQSEDDIAIYYEGSEYSQQIVSVSKGVKIPYYASPGAYIEDDAVVIDNQIICKTSDIKLLGKHNWQNICAAVTATWQVTQNIDAIKRAVTTIQGLEHRLEPVRIIDDVTYYSDSFAAGPMATLAAIEAIHQPKVMIVGGYDRGVNLNELAAGVFASGQSMRKMLLIGSSAQRMAEALEHHEFTNYEILPARTMPEIVEAARQTAKKGDAVVLSPGFASFDMFKNFADRGDQFKAAVHAL